MMHFAKALNFWLLDFLNFFIKDRKLVEKMIHQLKEK